MQQKYVPLAEEIHSSIQASTMRRQPNTGKTNVQKPQAVHELRKSYKQSLLAFIGWDRTFGAE